MNFLEIAQQDKAFTLKDSEFGFGTEITLKDPNLFTAVVTGRTNDISFAIDPNTGEAVSGRTVEITIDMQELEEKGFSSFPTAQSDKTKKPWIVEWTDTLGKSYSFTIQEANPDRTLGNVHCTLNFYKK
jgi:hypothetical protein